MGHTRMRDRGRKIERGRRRWSGREGEGEREGGEGWREEGINTSGTTRAMIIRIVRYEHIMYIHNQSHDHPHCKV